jgi:hypothetical protein
LKENIMAGLDRTDFEYFSQLGVHAKPEFDGFHEFHSAAERAAAVRAGGAVAHGLLALRCYEKSAPLT